jgi:TRAP-type C4-dicarboxylate transport system permease large subunit
MTIAVFMGSLLGAMALGMPIAFALLLCGVALMYQQDLFDAQIVAQNVINGADSFPLMAVPFFMLAGEVMNTGGLSRRIVNLALTLVGHVKGGLGYVAILAACILSALSGSAVADAAALSELLAPLMDSPMLLMFAMMALVIAVGTAMDMTPTILILTPVLVPVCKEAGIDPIYFGVLFIINNSIGLITPPVGTVLNVVAGVTRTSMEDLIKGVWPFMLAEFVILLLLILFPALVTVPAAWLSAR